MVASAAAAGIQVWGLFMVCKGGTLAVLAQGFDAFLTCWPEVQASWGAQMPNSWMSIISFRHECNAFLINGNRASLLLDEVMANA